MTQTIIMTLAAVQFVACACLITARTPFYIFMFQFFPGVLAIGLALMAFGRFMGWPV